MLNYNMDIGEKSTWVTTTPGSFARSLPFYCTEIGEFYAGENFYTERDSKNSYWLVYTVDGAGELAYHSNNVTLFTGSCYLMDCREYQCYRTAPNKKLWHHYWIHLDGCGVDGYNKKLDLSCDAVLVDLYAQELFKALLYHSKQSTTDDSIEISNLLHNLLHTLFKAQQLNRENSDSRRESILLCAKYLQEQYETKISLEDMAMRAHLSKYHFIRLFKKYMGASPYEYLLHYRITKAKQQLCLSDQSIAQISLKTGFSSESNFSTQFSRITGMSPLKYRKEHYSMMDRK